MTDAEIERVIRRAGYDVRWDDVPNHGAAEVYALRDGKRHTRSHPTLLALAEYLGCLERPVKFIEDREALDTVIEKHAKERNAFTVQPGACRVVVFGRNKYVQLVSVGGHESAMYELRTDGLRRTSNGNLPPEVVAAFARAVR
jgi:arginine deiminase